MKLLNPSTFNLRRTNSSRSALTAILVFGFMFAIPAYTEQQSSKPLELKPYSLSYSATLGGIKIAATHQLKIEGEQYSLVAKAKNFLGEITELANFKVSEAGDIVPLEYSRRQKTLMGKQSESQQFDWDNKTLAYSVKDTSGKINLLPSQFDRLSLNQQLRIDAASGKSEFAHTVIRKGQLKQYQYKVLGREIINTSNGSFNSLLVERLGHNANRKAKIWLATDWDFIILKMQTFEKDSKKILVLDQGQLNGNAILPIKKMAEI